MPDLTPLSNDIEDKMIHHIGYCTVYWSWAEQALSDVIEILHERGGDAIQAHLPVSLGPKLRYARKAANADILPDDLATRLNALVDLFHATKRLRHDLTHGVASFERAVGKWVIIRTHYKGATAEDDWATYDQQDLVAAMTRIDELCDVSLAFREDVWPWAGIEPAPDGPLIHDR
jgi:hypothetical protein